MSKYARIDISGLFYTREDCDKILKNHNYILEIFSGDKFVGYSQYERPIWILKERVVFGYGVTYKKKIYRILNSKEIGID